MDKATQDQLVAELARGLIAQVAPQEMPLFRANSAAYFQNPEKVLKGQAGKDELLGFGAGEAISFLTPIALVVTVEVVKFVTEEVRKSVKAESANLISDVVKSMFKKFRPAVEKEKKSVPLLTQEQLQEIHKIAVAKARQLKLSESKAKQLADGLIGDMVIYG